MQAGSLIRQLAPLLDIKAARIAIIVALVSLSVVGIWLNALPSPCAWFLKVTEYLENRWLLGLAVVLVWSFCLFLTVLPFGTATILVAGYFLGPVAGISQYIALIAASIVLYEIGRDSDPKALERRLEKFPSLSRVAGLARRRGFAFSALLRIVPVVPSAVASLAASYFSVDRRSFILGTILAGWCRPLGFAFLGSLGRFAPVCGIDPMMPSVTF